MIQEYIQSLFGKIYKMLPIFEENKEALPIYAKSLAIELIGATFTFPVLKTEKHYIDIINIVNYIAENDIDHFTCKKQVFKCRDLVGKIWVEEV